MKTLNRASTLFASLLFFNLITTAAHAATITVNYRPLGTYQTPVLVEGGIMVSGSADVFALYANGLGIVGGIDDGRVDTHEWIVFSFDNGSASDVIYSNAHAGNSFGTGDINILGERILEAFDTSGLSLGTVFQDDVGYFNVNALFGYVPISSFKLTSPGWDSFRVEQITYSTVPAPPALGLLDSGLLLGLIGISKRKKTA